MTKEQQAWYDGGVSAQDEFKLHPDRLFQEEWNLWLDLVDRGEENLHHLVAHFPYFKQGFLKAAKELKI